MTHSNFKVINNLECVDNISTNDQLKIIVLFYRLI
jgi:hypothetical protein